MGAVGCWRVWWVVLEGVVNPGLGLRWCSPSLSFVSRGVPLAPSGRGGEFFSHSFPRTGPGPWFRGHPVSGRWLTFLMQTRAIQQITDTGSAAELLGYRADPQGRRRSRRGRPPRRRGRVGRDAPPGVDPRRGDLARHHRLRRRGRSPAGRGRGADGGGVLRRRARRRAEDVHRRRAQPDRPRPGAEVPPAPDPHPRHRRDVGAVAGPEDRRTHARAVVGRGGVRRHPRRPVRPPGRAGPSSNASSPRPRPGSCPPQHSPMRRPQPSGAT